MHNVLHVYFYGEKAGSLTNFNVRNYFHIMFKLAFLPKYLDDFKNKNRLRITKTCTFNLPKVLFEKMKFENSAQSLTKRSGAKA
jgi:hypothetical protein